MGRKDLMDVMCAGHRIDPLALRDREYRGISLGLPRWVERLTWKKFKKVFHYDPEREALRGWNVRMVQNGLEQPWEPLLLAGRRDAENQPRTFGHFGVVSAAPYRLPRACGAGLMIDYGLGGNGWLDPVRWLRDPVVAVNPGSAELLLGWSYLDFGWVRVPTPSYFVLARDMPLSHRVLPARPGAVPMIAAVGKHAHGGTREADGHE